VVTVYMKLGSHSLTCTVAVSDSQWPSGEHWGVSGDILLLSLLYRT
jgi:hypothetical protein